MGRVVVHVCIMLQALLWNMFSFLERHPLAGGGFVHIRNCLHEAGDQSSYALHFGVCGFFSSCGQAGGGLLLAGAIIVLWLRGHGGHGWAASQHWACVFVFVLASRRGHMMLIPSHSTFDYSLMAAGTGCSSVLRTLYEPGMS